MAEISKFIRGMEADLRDIDVSRAQYKRILLSKLTRKVREHVVHLVDEEGCTYDSLKWKLLEKVGLSRRDLEIKLFNPFVPDPALKRGETGWLLRIFKNSYFIARTFRLHTQVPNALEKHLK